MADRDLKLKNLTSIHHTHLNSGRRQQTANQKPGNGSMRVLFGAIATTRGLRLKWARNYSRARRESAADDYIIGCRRPVVFALVLRCTPSQPNCAMSATEQNSIQHIANQATSLKQFYDLFLEFVSSSLSGIGAVAWNSSPNGLSPIAQFQSDPSQPIKMGVSESKHNALLQQAIASPDPLVIRSGPTDANAGAADDSNPTVLMAKIRRGDALDLIELFIPGGLSEETNISRLRELALMCREVEATRPNAAQGQPTATPPAQTETSESSIVITTNQMDQYVHVLHQSLDPADTAKKIVNETRRVLDCDRVTMLKVVGSRVRAVAISGQPSVNRRSNTVSLLEKAARKIIATRQTFWFPTDQPQPPQIENPLREYLATSATRSLVVHPVFDSAEQDLAHPDKRQRRRPPEKKLIGGIVIEHCKEQWNPETVAPVVDMACRHAADAWRNSWQHHNLFAYPVWHWLGKSKVLASAKNLPKTLLAIGGLTLFMLAMLLVQTDFRMTCDGLLIPESRRNVFANITGIVREVFVDHGQKVEKDQPLVRMENIELAQQIGTAEGKSEELTALISSVRTSMSQARGENDAPRTENIAALEAQLKSVERELELLRDKAQRLTITSPIAGSVVTYDVNDILKDRPVQRVDTLMEVADLAGNWQLELNLPDRKIGHVLRAYEENDRKPLDVEFILAADPGETFKGKLIEIGETTEMLPESGQHLKLKVEVEKQSLSIKQLRSGVDAYIYCGKVSLGYAIFHPVKEFVQTKVLFPFF